MALLWLGVTTASALAVVILSLLLEGVDRKIRARMQGRVGPPVVQPFYDLVKLLSKDRIVPVTAARHVFTGAPLLSAICSIAGGAVALSSLIAEVGFAGDLLLIFYFLATARLLALIGGASSGNPLAAVGTWRGVSLLASYKPAMLTAAVAVTLTADPPLSIVGAIRFQKSLGSCLAVSSYWAAVAFIAYLLCMPAEAEVQPFDVAMADTEIVYGYAIEYGGPHLALMRLSKSVSRFSSSLLLSALFLYQPLSDGLAATLVAVAVAFATLLIAATVPSVVLARVRTRQAVRFNWLVPTPLAMVALALSLTGWYL